MSLRSFSLLTSSSLLTSCGTICRHNLSGLLGWDVGRRLSPVKNPWVDAVPFLNYKFQCCFLVVFSFFEKTTYCCRTRRLSVRLSVRPSVRLSVRLSVRPSVRPSVEIISFRGNSLPNRPIELKIGLNVREGVVHVRKA